ncbi:MAG: HEAT repeat domain-containing protein [Planctomycetota bacterium]
MRRLSQLSAVALAAFAWTLAPLTAAPQEAPTTTIMRMALAGDPLSDDDVAGAFVLSDPGARRELLAVLTDLPKERTQGVREDDRVALMRLRAQVARAPRRFARGLTEIDGRHANAEHIIAAGLDIAGTLGDSDDVKAAITLAGAWPKEGPARIAARPEALRTALSLLLARHPEACGEVRQAYRQTPDALAGALVDALGDQESEGSVRALALCLAVRPELDAQVLNRLQGAARNANVQLHTTELAPVRRFLDSARPFERSQAALCLGQLDDIESVEALLPLLRDADPSVVDSAHWSLKALTAMSMGPDARRWNGWFNEQSVAWIERSQEFLGRLVSADRAEQIRGLNDISALRLHRAEITPLLVQLLEAETNTDVLVHVCAAIESLRAKEAIPAVVEALAHKEPRVRDRALRTLRVVTGRDLPLDEGVWRRKLGL